MPSPMRSEREKVRLGGERVRVRISRPALRYFELWNQLGPEGTEMKNTDANVCVHSDATDLG